MRSRRLALRLRQPRKQIATASDKNAAAFARKLSTGTYDNGGPLLPGWTMAFNGTGKPENVQTAAQGGAIEELVSAVREFESMRQAPLQHVENQYNSIPGDVDLALRRAAFYERAHRTARGI